MRGLEMILDAFRLEKSDCVDSEKAVPEKDHMALVIGTLVAFLLVIPGN